MKHRAFTESRLRGGREYHRACCKDCTWTSTWQPGEVSMAGNAAELHERLRERAALT